jgi:hypothetical protein
MSHRDTEDTASLLRDASLGDAAEVLIQNLDETALLGCVGLDADALGTADATLVSVVLDMSGSMEPHRQEVIEAYNTMIRSLAAAKASTSILVSTWAFEDVPRLLSSYEAVEQKQRLTQSV